MTALQLGGLIHIGDGRALSGEILEQVETDVGVSHLAAAEADRNLDAVPIGSGISGRCGA